MKKFYLVVWLIILTYYIFGFEKKLAKYHCTITLPDSNICISLAIRGNDVFLMPYSKFATSFLYKYELKTCSYKGLILYPDEVKYCFIPKSDTVTWGKIQGSKNFCYPCTFSIRSLFPEFFSGEIFAWAYTLDKNDSNGFSFIPRKVIFKLTTNNPNPQKIEIKNSNISLFPFGKLPLKGDTLICFGKERENKLEKSYIYLFNLKTEEYQKLLLLDTIFVKSNSEIGQTYFINDSIVIFYFYNQTSPLLYNIHSRTHAFLTYKGVLSNPQNQNYFFSIDGNDTMRTFMHKFLLSNENIALVGGKIRGNNFDKYLVKNIFIQLYNHNDLSLFKEYEITFSSEKNYSLFDVFGLPNDKSKVFLLLKVTNENTYDIFSFEL